MANRENVMAQALAQAVVVEHAEAAPVGRRELAALVGALAGLTVTGCAAYGGGEGEGEGKEPIGALGEVAQALASGLALRWVDTVLGARPPEARTGALATLNSADLGEAIVVIAKACVTAGDGGGGVFYWDDSSATPDDGGTIIVPTSGGGRWVRIYSGPLDVRWFGARKTDPNNSYEPPDNASPIQNAINAAGAAGGGTVFIPPGTYVTSARNLLPNVMLAGAGPKRSVLKLEDGVNEPILYSSGVANCGIRDLGFDGNNAKQGDRNHSGAINDYQPVKFNDCNDLHIENIFIDRGTGASKGRPGISAGLYITRCLRFRVHNVEVTGNGLGDGIQINNSGKFEVVNPYVHNMAYGPSPETNDRIEGINIEICGEWTLVNPRVHDLGGDAGSGYTILWSRGIQTSKCEDFSILGGHIARVHQGIDITGSSWNRRWEVANVTAQDCYSYGFKAANTAQDGTFSNCIAQRCGTAGFIVSSPSAANLPLKTADINLVGCTAYDCRANGAASNPPDPTAGFLVKKYQDPNTTLGIRFIGCKAIDRVGNMKYGFLSEIDSEYATDGRYVECIDCVSVGHTLVALSGFHAPHCEVGLATAQLIPTSKWTRVSWTTDVDHGAMHNTASNNFNVYVRRAGTYTAQFGVVFEANGTGQRGARILLNGAVVPGTTILTWPGVTGQTSVFTSTLRRLTDAGYNFQLEVFQDSERDLFLGTTSGGVVEQVA